MYLLESFGSQSVNVTKSQENHDISGKARGIKGSGKGQAHLRQKEKPIRAGGDCPHHKVPACLLSWLIPNPHQSLNRENMGHSVTAKALEQTKAIHLPNTEEEASIPCDMVQSRDINSF